MKLLRWDLILDFNIRFPLIRLLQFLSDLKSTIFFYQIGCEFLPIQDFLYIICLINEFLH